MPLLSRNHILLAGLCSLLAVSLAYAYVSTPAPPDIPVMRWPGAASAAPLPLAPPLPPVETFAAVDARPLFNPARKPVQPKPTAQAAAALPTDVTLVGVIMGGDRRVALLHTAGANYSTSVQIGATVNGWQVFEIDADRVVLKSGDSSYIVPLSFSHAGAPATPSSDAAEPALSPAGNAKP